MILDITLIPFLVVILFIIGALSLLWEDPKYDYISGENRRIHKETGVEERLCHFPALNYWDRDITRWVKIQKEVNQE